MPSDRLSAIREKIAKMSPEQRARLRSALESRREQRQTTTMSRTGRPLRPFQGQEQTDLGYTDNPMADAIAGGMGTAAGLGGALVPAAAALAAGGGVSGMLAASAPVALRAGIGAGVGGVLGASPLPVVGGHGFVEGAKFGALLGAGEGGMGALWKHGKKKKLLSFLIDKVEDAARGTSKAGTGKALASVADDVASAEAAAAQKLAMQERRLAVAEKRAAIAEERNRLVRMKLEQKAGDVARSKPTAKILPEGQRSMATNLGGKAKPGPAPTADSELEDALRRSIESGKESGLRGPRIQRGAQKVGREAGLTKEEVRRQAGPVLDEALGEASPILPKEALKSIIDKMKSIPMAEREAYVARATSGKAKWQVENIRRTLEHLGLLLPAGVAAGVIAEEGQ